MTQQAAHDRDYLLSDEKRNDVLALDEVLRHRRAFGPVLSRELDLVGYDLADGRLGEALRLVRGECRVEVGTDASGRAGVLERMAGRALLREELLAARRVACRRHSARAGVAPCDDEGAERECGDRGEAH
jgi:hypothetical protein